MARYGFNTHLSVLLHVGCESKNKRVKHQTENMKSKSENHIFKQSVAINPGPYICMGARVDALLLSCGVCCRQVITVQFINDSK